MTMSPSFLGMPMPEQPMLFDQEEIIDVEMDASPISEEDQNDLVDRLHSHYSEFKSDVSKLHQDITKWHELYEFHGPDTKEFPWEGSSNFQVPIIRATIDSMQSRIAKAAFDVDPLWLTKPRTAQGTELAKVAEKYLDYWADFIDLPRVLDTAIQGMLIEGVSVVKVDWVRQRAPQEYDEMGNPAPEVLLYDAPQVSYVPAADFVLMPANSPTIEEATYVGHRVFLTRLQLEARRDAGMYFNVDKLFDTTTGSKIIERNTGHSPIVASHKGNVKYPETNQYELVEVYGPYDFGNGPEPAVMTFAPDKKILLRIEPYAYQHGRPPYVDFCILPRPNLFWGFSFAEILASAQEELTALHNARSDALALSIAPPILRRIGAPWDPDQDPYGPSQVIDVNDPAEIVMMSIPPVGNAAFSHEADILAFVERVTGLSDYHMGRNANLGRTATEVNRVTSEGLARLDTMMSRFQHGGMKKLGWMLWWLLYQYRPFLDYFYYDGAEYTINKVQKHPSNNGMMSFEVQPHGILSDASKEARRQQKLMMFNTAAPMLSQFYPDGIQKMLKDILEDFDVHDTDTILGPPWSVIQQQIQQAYQQGMQEGMQQGVQSAAQAQAGN